MSKKRGRPQTGPFANRHTKYATRRFSTFLHPLLYNKRNRRAVILKGSKNGPIKKTDDCWVPINVAAALFECSTQTIRILWGDGKVRSVKYPNCSLLVYLPDVLFFEFDEDDQKILDEV